MFQKIVTGDSRLPDTFLRTAAGRIHWPAKMCVGFSDTPACAYVCPIDVCVDDPDRRETEEELFARALRLHPDLPRDMTLTSATSHFR